MDQNTIPKDILKIQKKLATFEKNSRNYKKYSKILKKHIKNHNMKNRVKSHIKTIDTIAKITQDNHEQLKNYTISLEDIMKKDI